MSMTATDVLAWPSIINRVYTMSENVSSGEALRTCRALKQTEIIEHTVDKCILHISVRKRKRLACNRFCEYQ